MSCDIRSIMTRYPLGSAIFTPPTFTNSAVTPSAFILLIFSTTAGGNVFSIPKIIPIFFVFTNHSCVHSKTHSPQNTFPPSAATRANHARCGPPKHPTNAEFLLPASPAPISHSGPDTYPIPRLPKQCSSPDTGSKNTHPTYSPDNTEDN